MKKIDIAILSIIFFFASLFFPCFSTNNSVSGLGALLAGILGTVCGGSNLCWFANPMILGSWISSYFNNLVAFILSSIGSILSILFFFATEVAIDEAGTPRKIESLEIGYWFWLLSILIMFMSTGIKFRGDIKKRTSVST